jgi:hypothetical protein
VLVTPGLHGDAVSVRLHTLVTDGNADPAGLQFNHYRGTLARVGDHWRIKELIATSTEIIV